MRIIAIVFNFGIFGFMIGLIVYGIFSGDIKDGGFFDTVGVILILIGFAITLIVLFEKTKVTNWLSLYIKRKMLEEERKIEELTKHKSDTPKGGN